MLNSQKGMASLIIMAIIVGVLAISSASYLIINKPRSGNLSFNNDLSSPVCLKWRSNIEQAFINDNYCQTDSDCQAIPLGGKLVAFGCVHYLNKIIASSTVYSTLEAYTEKCSKAINKCGYALKAVCQNNKCVAAEPTDGGATDDTIIYEKSEGWGPCPSEGVCWKDTFLYKSGKVIFKGKTGFERTIDAATVNIIIQKIKNLMTKDCSALAVTDYWATSKLTLDGRTREIQFPGCSQELGEIEALLPVVDMPVDGGA